MSEPILQVERLSKTFGGVRAVHDLSFSVPRSTIYSIIGPNGAGKTTVFNLISGLYTPTSGHIRLAGREITGLPPHRLATLGVSRTFQNLQICMNMTAIENVMVGRHLLLERSFLKAMLRLPAIVRGDRACRDKAAQLMEFAGIGRYLGADADAMPYGALKRLEIARALASDPTLVMLDEPAAGLNPSETGEVDELVNRIAESGVTVVLVEHDMKLVMHISRHILVLDYGSRLAEGTPEEVRGNPDVIAAYLGSA